MNSITTRQAVLADIDALATLFDEYRQFYGCTSDTKAAHAFPVDRFAHGESILFLAFQANEPIGFTQLYPNFSSISLGRTFILNDLFVHSSGRNKGVGTRFLHAATEYAKAIGAIRLSLSTATANITAQSLYQATGWQRDRNVSINFMPMSLPFRANPTLNPAPFSRWTLCDKAAQSR